MQTFRGTCILRILNAECSIVALPPRYMRVGFVVERSDIGENTDEIMRPMMLEKVGLGFAFNIRAGDQPR